MKDYISEDRLNKLHPKVRADFRAFIEEAEAGLGITLRITQGLRTFEEQAKIYAQGRTAPGKIVSNARPGSSYHNYGLAIDLVRMDGQPDWNYDMSNLTQYAEQFGISWGGNFKSIKDKPHFEKSLGYSWRQLLEKYQKGDLVDGYVNI